MNRIIQGDALTVLKTLPDEIIDCVVTSPPYWGLRDYGIEGQIGLEPTLEEYINKLLAITQELKRVLKKTGVMFWNHGDCYGGSGSGTYSESSWQRKGRDQIMGMCKESYVLPGGKNRLAQFRKGQYQKCLIAQNYRLVLQMVDKQQWLWRNTIIWHKPNHMPSSVKDRFSNAYEPVFMLTKSRKYYFDLDAVRVPHQTDEGRPPGVVRKRVFNYRVRDAEKKAKMCPQFKVSQTEIEKYKKETGKI